MTEYLWHDNPTAVGQDCDPDILNECLMHLKYEKNKRFTINSGNMRGSTPNILNFKDNTICFKVGNGYPSLVATTAHGKKFEIDSLDPLVLEPLDNGNYIVFVGADKSFDVVKYSNYIKSNGSPLNFPTFTSNSQDGFTFSGSGIASGSAYYKSFIDGATYSAANSYVQMTMPCFMKSSKWLVISYYDNKSIKTGKIEVRNRAGVWISAAEIDKTVLSTNVFSSYDSLCPDEEFDAIRMTCYTNFGSTQAWVFGCFPSDYTVTQWDSKEDLVWLNTYKNANNVYIIKNAQLVEYEKVPLIKFNISANKISWGISCLHNAMNSCNYFIPDYDRADEKIINTRYTEDVDGYVIMSAEGGAGAESGIQIVIYKGNSVFTKIHNRFFYPGFGSCASAQAFIPRGYSYMGVPYGGNTITKYIFCPLKGVN